MMDMKTPLRAVVKSALANTRACERLGARQHDLDELAEAAMQALARELLTIFAPRKPEKGD